VDALKRSAKTFGPNIHIEAGASIVRELIDAGSIDQLELSITDVVGGEDVIDVKELLSHFSQIDEKTEAGTRFISARR
jgi:dihydrofolate reductase